MPIGSVLRAGWRMKALTASMASIGTAAGRTREGEVEAFSEGLGRGSTFTLPFGQVQPRLHQAEEHQGVRPQVLCERSLYLWAVGRVRDGGRTILAAGSIARIIGRFGDDPEPWSIKRKF